MVQRWPRTGRKTVATSQGAGETTPKYGLGQMTPGESDSGLSATIGARHHDGSAHAVLLLLLDLRQLHPLSPPPSPLSPSGMRAAPRDSGAFRHNVPPPAALVASLLASFPRHSSMPLQPPKNVSCACCSFADGLARVQSSAEWRTSVGLVGRAGSRVAKWSASAPGTVRVLGLSQRRARYSGESTISCAMSAVCC